MLSIFLIILIIFFKKFKVKIYVNLIKYLIIYIIFLFDVSFLDNFINEDNNIEKTEFNLPKEKPVFDSSLTRFYIFCLIAAFIYLEILKQSNDSEVSGLVFGPYFREFPYYCNPQFKPTWPAYDAIIHFRQMENPPEDILEFMKKYDKAHPEGGPCDHFYGCCTDFDFLYKKYNIIIDDNK